jgi:DNA-binding MarR family transcriptional regulator
MAPFGHAVGFLLAQLGFVATREFRAGLEPLSLEPRHFGLLRAIEASDRLSQQALAETLRIPASSVVALLDDLESRDLARRRLDPADRRVRLVELTDTGRALLAQAFEVAIGIESALCRGFSALERESLISTLEKVATNMNLALGVHPAGRDL